MWNLQICDCSPDCTIPYGYCHCGCGEKTNIIKWSNKPRGDVKGEPRRYINGHGSRIKPADFPDQYCACGCGEITPRAKRTSAQMGVVKGQPLTYINLHHLNKIRLYDNGFKVEDRGYKTPCWVWQWCIDQGYAVLTVDSPRGRVNNRVHRITYQDKFGKIDDSVPLDHLCRLRCCVNPDHLEPVTTGENVRRGALTKLNWDKVAELRGIVYVNRQHMKDVSKQYNISIRNLEFVLAGKTWPESARPKK